MMMRSSARLRAAARGAKHARRPLSSAIPGTNSALTLQDASLLRDNANLVNGAWTGLSASAPIPVLNKATGLPMGSVPSATADETRAAVAAAAEAFRSYRAVPALERGNALAEVARRLRARKEDLARIITAENGKPLAEARGEVEYSAAYFDWFAGEAPRAYGDVIPSPQRSSRMVVLREPVGVVACITPWNFPLAMLARKVAAALAAGCTVVAKPSELTPYSALALGAVLEEGGLVPPGVFNCVTGHGAEVGGALTADPAVRKVSFTGSTAVGKLLMRQSADTVKRVSMELGGLAPFIVFDDADAELAVRGIVAAKFRNAGQTCVSAQRILVQRGAYERVAELLAAEAAALRVAVPWEDGAQIGPVINAAGVDKVRGHVEDAVARGAEVLHGGAVHGALGGNFFVPTVLAGVDAGAACMREETFGPLAPVSPFDDEEEALAAANASSSGLAAYAYTSSQSRAWRVAEALESGMVGVNESAISSAVAPFGGVKESGTGREGSKYGLDDYTNVKYVNFGGM